jgi:hypothetical protein
VFVLRLVTSSLKLEVGVGMVRVTRLPPSGRNTCVVSRVLSMDLGLSRGFGIRLYVDQMECEFIEPEILLRDIINGN